MGFCDTDFVPPSFEAGNTVTFSVDLADYPPASYALVFVFSRPGATPVSTAATAGGLGYVVTLPGTATAGVAPGDYDWALYATDGNGNRTTAAQGALEVLPNLAAPQMPSLAAQTLAGLQTGMQTLSSGTIQTFSGGGQSWSKKNLKELQEAIVYWESRVIKERRDADAKRGRPNNGTIEPRFVMPGCGVPLGYGRGRYGNLP